MQLAAHLIQTHYLSGMVRVVGNGHSHTLTTDEISKKNEY